MRGASLGLIVVGVVVLLVGLINHFAIHANPVAHFSTVVLALGAVLAVVGFALMAMGGSKGAAR
jgi:hypothetical protein